MIFQKKIKNLQDVPRWQLCCGCGVCAYLYPKAIKMIDVPSFGRRPQFIRNDQESYQLGLQACPGIGLTHKSNENEDNKVIPSLMQSWGPIYEIWEAYAVDPQIHYQGSSGGAITAIALYCLEQEQMQGVLHVTADKKRPYLNTTTISKDRESLLEGMGSRYSPASPCEKLDAIEKSSKLNVIVGKPCDIAAVQKARLLSDRLNSNIGLTIACFCAGTPSTAGTFKMLNKMGVGKQHNLIGLRYRGYGWPGKTRAEFRTEGGKVSTSELSYEDAWGEVLQKFRQWRCYICPDHTGEFADLSVGDPWYKEEEKGDNGRSLILVRSARGEKFLRGAIEKGYLVAEKKENYVLLASQTNLQKTRFKLWGQIFALKLFCIPTPNYIGFSLFSLWRDNLSCSEKVRSVVGTMKRIFVKKIIIKQKS